MSATLNTSWDQLFDICSYGVYVVILQMVALEYIGMRCITVHTRKISTTKFCNIAAQQQSFRLSAYMLARTITLSLHTHGFGILC